MDSKRFYVIGLCLLSVTVVLALAETEGALADTSQRQLRQVPPRKTGLLYQDKGLRSPPNNTRRGYSLSRGKASTVRNLGAGSNATQIARAACSKDNILDSECIDVLLLALTPSSYSSNDTRDTPGRRSCISPAQDQGECSSCVGFAVTAAAEAAINVHRQQSWRSFNLSEQDLSFCKLQPRVNCVTGASYDGVISSFLRRDVQSWAARSCFGYTGSANQPCLRADSCSNQLSGDMPLSWAYDANALDSMAKVKQRIMLSGGVIASMAMSDAAFRQFQTYGAAGDAVFAPNEDLAGLPATMHAIFCYGWWDNPKYTVDGWWLCKNSWGPSWGLNGSFKVAYGAAYIMQPDYTFALEVKESVSQVQQRFTQALTYPAKPGCVQYSPKQPERLLKLADDLTTLALAAQVPVSLPQVLTDLVTGNLGRVRNISAATRGPFRLCGKYLGQVLKTVACLNPPQQQPDAQPWNGCKPALGSICSVRCITGANLESYRAVCSLNKGIATWQVTGGCSAANVTATGPIVVQAEPALCVTAPLQAETRQQVTLRACGGSLKDLQQFEYKEGKIQLKAVGTNWCLGVMGGSSDDGAQVLASSCNGSANQRWMKDAVGGLRPLHALQSCLGTAGGSAGPGVTLQIWNCSQSKSQLFWAVWMPYLEGRAGVISLTTYTDLCISAPGFVQQRRAELQPCSSINSSSRFVSQPDGSLRWGDTKWCLDVFNSEKGFGVGIGVWECTGLPNQRWWKDVQGALHPMHAPQDCMDVPSSNFSPGTQLQLWPCNQSPAQYYKADWMPGWPTPAYLGCFRSKASDSGGITGLPELLSEELTAGNTTEQCWKFAAGARALMLPLFGVNGRNCFGGSSLLDATALGAAPESACAANKPDVVALYQLVPPGAPIPRGCVTDDKAFLKGLPAEESFGTTIRDAAPASYAIARAFALMKGAKYFAVSGAVKDDWGYTFDKDPTTAPRLNVTVGGALGCYTPCADDTSKACGSSASSSSATAPRAWFVYELPV